MSDDQQRLESENLIQVHQAPDECAGNLIAGFLRDNGIEATLECRTPRARAALAAGYCDPDTAARIFVLEHEAERARALVDEFLTAALDEHALEEEALQTPPLDKETITPPPDAGPHPE